MLNRRGLLAGMAGAGILAGCGPASEEEYVAPDGPEVTAAQAARSAGPVHRFAMAAGPTQVDLAGQVVDTWAYGGRIPGREVRVTAGQQIEASVVNGLPQPTTVHWHGIRLRNDADGVPGVTQAPIAVAQQYTYRFTVPDPGTYWLHPHVGVQLDRGLYAPLVVEDTAEPLGYDQEWVVVLDDWVDGLGTTPDQVLDDLRRGRPMMGGHGGHGMTGGLLGGDAGDVTYPLFLCNGRPPADPETFTARPGTTVRIRLINAAADTAFRVAVDGHAMTVVHADGMPVQPVDTDALLIGMGERYDVLMRLGDGAFGLHALAEGKDGAAFAVIRAGGGQAPSPQERPRELDGRIIGYRSLRPVDAVRLPRREVDDRARLELTGGMMSYDWGINGRRFDPDEPNPAVALTVGRRVRLDVVNATMMFHPVHLHGHSFAVGGVDGPRKDTVIVLPGQAVPLFFDADNPGLWMFHCHNVYHAETGMMTVLGYRRT